MNFDEVVKKYPEANFLQSPEYGKMNELLHDKVIVSDFNVSEAMTSWASPLE